MDYLTVRQAAEILELDVRTVRHRLENGTMDGERVTNRLWMIPIAEVDKWKRLGRMKPGPKPSPPPAPAAEEG